LNYETAGNEKLFPLALEGDSAAVSELLLRGNVVNVADRTLTREVISRTPVWNQQKTIVEGNLIQTDVVVNGVLKSTDTVYQANVVSTSSV